MTQTTEFRQHWMGVLARAPLAALESAWEELAPKPEYIMLRQPETGLVMVQARTNGSGAPFNMGEMTLTRCAVSMETTVGHAYVAGRSKRHAELAAVFDGLLQHAEKTEQVFESVIIPIEEQLVVKQKEEEQRVAATKVDFFTMVRGED